jgi:hypothetical protein
MTSFIDYLKKVHQPVIIDEQLKNTEEYAADRMKENGHSFYRNQFLGHNPKAKEAFTSSKEIKQHSIRVPVSLENDSEVPHSKVSDFLKEHKYIVSPEKYKQGLASQVTQVGNPEKGIPMREKVIDHKIGGLLEKHSASEDIKKNYTNDPYRTGAKTNNYDIVLSGHHHDVYGGSTGRGWTSCAQMRKGDSGSGGIASKSMAGEINNHTHNAYLVPRGGNVDTDAIGRVSFKHHTGLITGHETLLPEGRVYGSTPKGFLDSAKNIVSNLFDKKDDVYKKNKNVYNDSGNGFSFPEKMEPKHIDAAWKALSKNDDHEKKNLYQHIDPTQKYKSTELNNVGKHIKNVSDAANTGDFVKTMNAVRETGYGIEKDGHHSVTSNKHLDDALSKGAKTFNYRNPEHLNHLIESNAHGNHIKSTFTRKLSNTFPPPAKSIDDYHALSRLKDAGLSVGNSSYSGIPIDKKHDLGEYPHDTIVKSLSDRGDLDAKTYQKSYISTLDKKRKKGNMYDNAVHHENEGIHGMSNVIDEIGQNLKNSAFRNSYGGNSTDDALAESFYHMKPITRARFGESMDVNPTSLMRNNKKAINSYKELMKKVDDANIKKTVETPEE